MTKSKSRNLLNSKSRTLSKFKNSIKTQGIGIIKKSNFLTLNTKVVYTKLKQVFT